MPDDGGGSESGVEVTGVAPSSSDGSSGSIGFPPDAADAGYGNYGSSSGGSISYPTDADLNCDCGLSDTGSPDVGGETGSCGGGVCGLIVHPDSG
jgi:hypothetical protein